MSSAKYLVIAIFAGIVVMSDAQTAQPPTCVTTTGYNGFCVNIYKCPPLIRLITRIPLMPADAEYLRSNRCGTDGSTPMVCCVPEVTPVGRID